MILIVSFSGVKPAIFSIWVPGPSCLKADVRLTHGSF